MSHARRFRCLLIIYLPISLQLRLATRLIACLMRLMVGSPNGRGITPVSATLLGVPLSTADALRNRNRKLDISTPLTKDKPWNQLIHRRWSKAKSIGSGSDPQSQVGRQQWSNYQKISKGAHTIVNANEAMLLITGGSRTSESGGQIFSVSGINNIFGGVSKKIFLHFSKKMFNGRIGPPGSAQVGGPKAAPFEPLDFLQVGGPFREVGGPRPTLALWSFEHW